MDHHPMRFSRVILAAASVGLIGLLPPLTPRAIAQIPAFPGAEGPGATATGGRYGDVYHVTNLEFDVSGAIPGSLMYGIRTAPASGRTIVFDVGGTIYQPGGGPNFWFRASKDNITIAGQTAPGPGITIAGVATKWTGSNVILRNITVRPNKDPVNPSSYTYDAFSLQLQNSIVDHVTATWFTDEGISITDAGRNSTIQYASISEGLNYAGHAFGSIIATEVDGAQFSYHHNLYAHNNSRMPRLGSEVGTTGAVLNWSNNVIYNWQNKAGYSGTGQPSRSNFIGNYYIKGPNNGVTVFDGGDDATSVGFTQIYQSKTAALANKADYDRDGVLFDGVAFGPGDTMSNGQKYYSGSTTFVSTPFSVNGVGTPDLADVALARVLDYSGANW
jgi:pectate lyase